MRQKTIYFIVPVGIEMVKIGCSAFTESRMEQLSHWSPVPLRIAAAAPGDHKLEAFIHRKLAAHRSHKEWFRLTPEISDLIDAVNRGGNLTELVGAARVERKTRWMGVVHRYVPAPAA